MRIIGREIPKAYLLGGGLGLGALLIGRHVGLLGGSPLAPPATTTAAASAADSAGASLAADGTMWSDVGGFPAFPTTFSYWDPNQPPPSPPAVNDASPSSSIPIGNPPVATPFDPTQRGGATGASAGATRVGPTGRRV